MSSTESVPDASIVIAAYNAEPVIARAVRSALSQRSVTVEVIVVDDCSRDRTLRIVQDLAGPDPRIRVKSLSSNKGPGAARNDGFALSRAPWIAVLDSDDVMAPDRIRRLIDAAERVGADIISDNFVEIAGNDLATATAYLSEAKISWISAREYLTEGRLFHGGRDYGYLKPLFRAEALRAKRLSYNERLRIAEDDDLILRALLSGLRYWLEPLQSYFYFKHAASTSHRLSVPNASAMRAASAELIASHLQSPELPLLKMRHRALERGLAFVRLIDALKCKHWFEAAQIVAQNPTALPLLRMPIAAAVRRFVPALPSEPTPSEASVAARRAVELGLDQ